MMDNFDFMIRLGRLKAAREEFTPIWKKIDEQFRELTRGKSRVRFTLIAGHDTTLAVLVGGIGKAEYMGRPTYGSHVSSSGGVLAKGTDVREIWKGACGGSSTVTTESEVEITDTPSDH
jgi:hypothetical protein